MKYLTLAAAVGTCLILSACTTSEKVNVMQPGDRALTCTQLKGEFERLDAVKRDAEHDGGLNTANVAAVIFFWPAAAGNYLNTRSPGRARPILS